MSQPKTYPKFSKDQSSMYDLETYIGRFKHFQKLINPKTVFYSCKQLLEFHEIIQQQGNPKSPKRNDKELWDMKYAVASNLHPQLMKPVNVFFRLNTFIMANVPLGMGMSLLPPTAINQIISQGLNQSYNFAFNYCNRNASNPINMEELKKSYMYAIGTSIISSVGMQKLFQLAIPGEGMMKYFLMNYISPYTGCAFSSLCNLYFARAKDLNEGINILHPETQKVIGVSKKAGKRAFFQSMCMRLGTPAACILLPKYIDSICKKFNIAPYTFLGQQLFGAVITGGSIYAGLSVSLPIFPQLIKVSAKKLEPQFANIKDSKGKPIEHFYYDKGL